MNSIPKLTIGKEVYVYLYCMPNQPVVGKLLAQSMDGLMIDGDEYVWSVSIADIATIGTLKETQA